MKKKYIDILMATYNGETYLKEQIESILNQTHKDFRLIISDDCSKDSTREILSKYAKKDKRIKIYKQEKNLGYVKNFEFLLSKVENEYYMFSDQDDVWLPDKVKKSLETLIETNSDLAFSDLVVVDEKLDVIEESFLQYCGLTERVKKEQKYDTYYLHNSIAGCTIIGRKSMIDKIIPMPENTKFVIHDYWMGLISASYGKIAYIDRKDILYRQHDNNCVGYGGKNAKTLTRKELRKKILDEQLEKFHALNELKDRFPKEIQLKNKRALEYYKKIKDTKLINLDLKMYHDVYKGQTLKFYLKSMILLNLNIWK